MNKAQIKQKVKERAFAIFQSRQHNGRHGSADIDWAIAEMQIEQETRNWGRPGKKVTIRCRG